MTDPSPGQLRGIGLRLDPQGILFRPFEENGIQWGYTLKPEEGKPQIFMDGEWTDFVPEGVWLQMLDLWADMGKAMKENIGDIEFYLNYPEIVKLVK